MCRRVHFPGEVQKRTISGVQAVESMVSIILLEILTMATMASVMVTVMGEDRPTRRGEAVLMRANTEVAVAWVKRCRGVCGGGKKARVGPVMTIMGAPEAGG